MPPKSPELLTIGKVLDLIRQDYPDVAISKIRFLESAGLLTPQRTPAGYRMYAVHDIERLRYILRAQQEWFWPLKVIREALDALDRGLTPPHLDGVDARPRPSSPDPDPDVVHATDSRRTDRMQLTAQELSEAAGLDLETIASLESFGLIRPDERGLYAATDQRVAAAAASLAAYGIEARHLRSFRAAADREIGLIQQAIGGAREDAKRHSAAAIAQQCLQLHAALVKGGLESPSRRTVER